MTKKRFNNIVVHPRDVEDCPSGLNDCDNCPHREYIGTFGGEYYVDCNYEESGGS